MANIDFSTDPYGPKPEYGGNLAAGDPGRGLWQKWVGNTDNWLQQQMGLGNRITGNIPGMFQGDINNINRDGSPVNNIDVSGGKMWVPSSSGTVAPGTDQTGYWTAIPQWEQNDINNYQNWQYGQENQPGGGATQAWGQYQGYGPNTAANDWGGAYSAFAANQAIQGGFAPGSNYTPGTQGHTSSPLGVGPNGQFYNNTGGQTNWFNQFGIPEASPGNMTTGPSNPAQAGQPPPPPVASTPPPAPVLPNLQNYDPWAQYNFGGAGGF